MVWGGISHVEASADAILSSGKQIIVSIGHVGACTLKHERSEPFA
jgi:hypothetical protein